MFLDQAKIFIKSGNGGSGAVSFRREKYVPRGGPDGGDGGCGGHIILKARSELTTLIDFRYRRNFQAENGEPGAGSNRFGKDGADLVIPVPVGTVIKEAETGKVLADLATPDQELILLRGGRGGRGNARFATPTRQTPQFAEKGETGAELTVELELKLLADIGLVGFPNAGKSTLLSQISAARPKIADYPFTTIIPNLGVVSHRDRSFVAVDIPGLIEGAHRGIGLGDQFLKHIERTRILLHLVDMTGMEQDPFVAYSQLMDELRLYNPLLEKKPRIVVANKMDIPGSDENLAVFKKQLGDLTVYPISAATGAGVSELLDRVLQQLDELPPPEISVPQLAEEPMDEDRFAIRIIREEDGIRVENDALTRRVARYHLDNDDALRSLQKLLKRWGVIDALNNEGVNEGDLIRIGEFEFIYQSDEEI